MYKYFPVNDLINGAEQAATTPLHRYGVSVYVEKDADFAGPDFEIDPADTKGIEIFRNFCQQMAEHYKHLNTKP